MKNLKLLLLSTSILFSSQVFAMEESQKDLDWKLFQAIRNKDLNQIKAAIQAGAKVNAKGSFRRTPLMNAAYHGQPEAIKYLIDYCQSNNIKLDVNAKNILGQTTLMDAARCHPEAVKYLIKAGTDLNAKDDNGDTALMIAAQHQSEAVKYLIQAGADLNAKDNYGWTALMRAAEFQQPKTVKYLVLSGADLNQIKDDYPTQYQNALKEIKKWIFKNYPKDRNKVLSKIKFIALSGALKLIKDPNGNTLLHYAAIKEDVQLFGLIYSICPSLIATTNDNNQTPVQLALGNSKIFELIKKLALKNDNQNQEKENFEDHQSDDDDDDSTDSEENSNLYKAIRFLRSFLF